ncbi:MAG: pentapeptide repeat-containing protein, partial [Firmicutes bacterium]|nr:pentapeptide repeat-containing protein [Bacillota bacterium]
MEKEQNPITPEELRAALAEQPYDLSGRLLVGVRLEHRDLEGLYLRGATLRGCTFAHCKFDNSDFTDADLGDTQFIRCKMEY